MGVVVLALFLSVSHLADCFSPRRHENLDTRQHKREKREGVNCQKYTFDEGLPRYQLFGGELQDNRTTKEECGTLCLDLALADPDSCTRFAFDVVGNKCWIHDVLDLPNPTNFFPAEPSYTTYTRMDNDACVSPNRTAAEVQMTTASEPTTTASPTSYVNGTATATAAHGTATASPTSIVNGTTTATTMNFAATASPASYVNGTTTAAAMHLTTSTEQVATSPQTECVADLVFVIDDSGSIRDQNIEGQADNYQRIKNFAQGVVDKLNIGQNATRVGVVTFSDYATSHLYLSDYYDKASIKRVLDGLPYSGGNTNTTGSFREARQHILLPTRGERWNVTNVIVLITDGTTTREINGLMSEVNTIKSVGTRIVGVGITDQVNEQEMWSIVTDPRFYIGVDTFSSLASEASGAATLICQAANLP